MKDMRRYITRSQKRVASVSIGKCRIENPGGDGLQLDFTDDSKVEKCVIVDCPDGDGISLRFGTGNELAKNTGRWTGRWGSP